MARANTLPMVDIDECKKLIRTIGDKASVMIISEPGVGKSSILKALAEDFGDKWRSPKDEYPEDKYDYIYVDCPNKELMDVAASIPNHQSKTLEYYVSSLFKLDNGKPKVIMLDEMLKAPKMMQVLFTRLVLERFVGDKALPEGSFLFITSNNATDGVGDSMLAHVGNRIVKVHMAKPTALQWSQWATANNISSSIRTWVVMNPRVMASYIDGDQDDNEFIFKPSSTVKQFASPRSLAMADPIVRNSDILGENTTLAALCGTIGEAAARSLTATMRLEKNIAKYEDIIADPLGAVCPQEDVAALLMTMFQGVDRIDSHDELSKFMTWVERVKREEVQSIFFTLMMRMKIKLAGQNDKIRQWAKTNLELMG